MSLVRLARHAGMLLVVISCAAVPVHGEQRDTVARARGMAAAGQRLDAIALLQAAVGASPRDSDARVLLGTILSWEGRYDEARRELQTVLDDHPTHGDALSAIVNVELLTEHPGRVEELTRRGLRNTPNDTGLLFARARALGALDRQAEAGDALDRLLMIDPRHDQARELRRTVRADLRVWQVRAGSSLAGFSDRRTPWREAHVSLGRATPIGPVIFKGARASRFGVEDDQFEVEMYPRIRPGTYAYVAAAYAPDGVLFPTHRYAADLYQSLGGGFEGSAGFRWLGVGDGVKVYVASLSKYYGNWLFTGRASLTPDAVGTSRSYHGSFRRYFGDTGTYVGVRYGRGGWREEARSRNDFEVLDSDVAAMEATVILRRRLELNVSGSYSREDRVERLDLRQYSVSTSLGFRF